MYQGQHAIDYLISQVNYDDPAASSHWQKYHSNFHINNGIIEGIEGFGSNEISYKGLVKIAHFLLQLKYKLWAYRSIKRIITFLKFDAISKKILNKQNKGYSLDCLRQTLTLSFLHEKIPSAFNKQSTVLVIGDGFASMTNLIYSTNTANVIILINLTKTLLVDLLHIKKNLSQDDFTNNVYLISENEEINNLTMLVSNKRKKIILIEARHHKFLDYFPFNLVINIASLQEMNNNVIAEYFDHIHKKQNVFFYCCNRKEKSLPDGTVTKINEYPWRYNDKIIIDELCPWHQDYYTFSKPFYKKFDGLIIHQLRIMNQNILNE
jgi:hypothetical protein